MRRTTRPERRLPPPPRISTYWERVQWPIHSLYFLLPMLVAYEAGSLWLTATAGRPLPRILAESQMRHFFSVFGVSGLVLPGVLVVAVLLAWHAFRRDPWRPEPPLYIGMLSESVLLALPLFVFMLVLGRQPPHAAMALAAAGTQGVESLGGVTTWQQGMVTSVGAGIYEELLFRVIAIALLHIVLDDLFAVPEAWAAAGCVMGSALLFALYHFGAGWWNPLAWPELGPRFQGVHFVFYTTAGVYFAVVYVLRGLGVVAACHAVYDVLVTAMVFELV